MPMTMLTLIRHAPTDWNAARRLQGRSDVPLSTEGEKLMESKCLPDDLRAGRLISSPLSRARRTAMLLTGREAEIEPRLTEMDFGSWEGQTLAGLRAADPQAMQAEEDRGWHMTPPGGESPWMVWQRVAPLLAELAADGGPVVAVTHKGVIRAILARAWGWDFLGRAPARLESAVLHRLRLLRDGTPEILALNQALPKADAS